MRIGLDTFSFQLQLAAGNYDVFHMLDAVQRLGIAAVQININGPRGRFLGGEPSDTTHVRKVRRAAEGREIALEVAGGGTAPKKLDWQLRLSHELGAKVFRTTLAFDTSLDVTFAERRRDLLASLPLARELGVCIALENHEDITARELLAFVTEIDEPSLRICLDTGNDLSLYEDPLVGAGLLAPLACTTHIKDQKLIRVGGEVYSVGVPLGTGDVDLPAIVSVLERQSTLGRIMIQDTTGYASPLNPFNRPDVVPRESYDGVPAYGSKEEAYEDGFLLDVKTLPPAKVSEQAAMQDLRIQQDIAYVQGLCNSG